MSRRIFFVEKECAGPGEKMTGGNSDLLHRDVKHQTKCPSYMNQMQSVTSEILTSDQGTDFSRSPAKELQ